MGLIAGGDQAKPNSPPAWVSTPAPEYEDGVASNYDLLQHVSDADGDAITFTLNAGSAALPTGVTISGSNLAASTSVAEGTTTGVIIDADDGVNSKVASSAFSIVTIASGAESPAATIIVADSGGDYTVIQTALNNASASDVVEVEADTPGGTKYYAENLTLPVNGTDGNEVTLRGRLGDTIIVYATSGHILTLVSNSYWKFKNLQFGRDETENGWIYGDGLGEGRFAVEHDRWIQANNDNSHHFTFTDCTAYGGSFFDGGYVDLDCHHFGFYNLTLRYSGINAGDELPNRAGNIITFRGQNSIFEDCDAKFGGHDNLHIEAPYVVVRRGIYDGDWTDHQPTNPGKGNRSFTNEGQKGDLPLGPNLIELAVIRNADVDRVGDEQPAGKFSSFRAIIRRNFVFDNTDTAMNMSTSSIPGVAAMDEWHTYNNTFDNCGMMVRSTDIGLDAGGDEHFIDHAYKNNICNALGTGHPGDQSHIRYIRSNSAKRAGDADDWRSAIFDNNIFNTAAPNTFKARLSGDGGSNLETTLPLVEAEWPNVFTNNSSAAPTYVAQGDRTSDTYATIISAFELAGGSQGKGSAAALTTANGSGSSSTSLVVADSKYFYAGADPAGFDLSYFDEVGDWISVGTPIGTNVAQITAINYTTHTLTLDSPISWSDEDEIFLLDADGVTAIIDQGAQP